jgi:hypothetical protein
MILGLMLAAWSWAAMLWLCIEISKMNKSALMLEIKNTSSVWG